MRPGDRPMESIREAEPELTQAQQRKLRRWRRMLVGCLAAAGVALLTEVVLLAWPGVSHGLRLTVGAIFVELAISSAVLGAVGRCPACSAGFDASAQRLLPERCRQCRALLVLR
jgi:hypothetical protein